MQKLITMLALVFLGTFIASSAHAQIKPVVIDGQLRNLYQRYTSDLEVAKSRLDELKCRIESIYKKAPGQENDADIKAAVDPIKSDILATENSRDEALKGIDPVKDSIKKTIKDAKGAPVVWRTFSFGPPNERTELTETYTIEGGNIIIKSESTEIEKCQVR